ncbi:hypothetical protein C8F04DRAFT_67420 [Mycena alexandri]|uniref:Uncharacterized protein n=1 Tax=Mycena alexandri TaxID=1745969 RepID=A0AAD6WX16_9AGAR|nr:hypothetical protein C8F04DRAFT_67420 [Mycena alexandri]
MVSTSRKPWGLRKIASNTKPSCVASTLTLRANIDITVDFRRQDPAKLAAVYKLTRKEFPYLTRARFPLDWAIAEMTKQFLRNRRRYGVKCKRIPNREARKRAEASGGNKRRRGTGALPHIDDRGEDEDEDGVSGGEGGGDTE